MFCSEDACAGAVQGALRCVPKVQAADPRFQKSDQEKEFSTRTADHFFQPNDVAQVSSSMGGHATDKQT